MELHFILTVQRPTGPSGWTTQTIYGTVNVDHRATRSGVLEHAKDMARKSMGISRSEPIVVLCFSLGHEDLSDLWSAAAAS